ncbi:MULTISPECIES: hypothetical protein [unclassified Streptomyces]|uniref:hypothetical protein n=1 Tax=unclassified Streptomyces TaxID=2593676 RepID=UPI00224DE251|nr:MULTISPECIES: hypothetical protein [unclassified Streptomyces]MCX5327945.1 hypothetical protein [Streptomyces sp. NBC_00140]MCX5357435.1 hypothetical protein [Streptomyces sp. NBC_00124]
MLALTSCFSACDDKPAARASPTTTKEERYLETARSLPYTEVGAPTETELLVFPPQWCAGLDQRHMRVKGGRLRGERLCGASAGRSSPQAMDDARGQCALHSHVGFNTPAPAGIPDAELAGRRPE